MMFLIFWRAKLKEGKCGTSVAVRQKLRKLALGVGVKCGIKHLASILAIGWLADCWLYVSASQNKQVASLDMAGSLFVVEDGVCYTIRRANN